MMPEWYLVLCFLILLAGLERFWKPFELVLPVLALAAGLSVAQAMICTRHLSVWNPSQPVWFNLKQRATIVFLHLTQPLARLRGRLNYGLTFWRRRGAPGFIWPVPVSFAFFSRQWQAPEHRLDTIRQAMRADRTVVTCGGEFDNWDLEVLSGLFGGARLLMAIEEQGGGSQYIRLRVWPKIRPLGRVMLVTSLLFAVLPAMNGAWVVSAIFGALAILTAIGIGYQCGGATAAFVKAWEGREVKKAFPFFTAIRAWLPAAIRKRLNRVARIKSGAEV